MKTQWRDEFTRDPELSLAVRLMQEGAPENGIDLGPAWDRLLQQERRDVAGSSRRFSSWVGAPLARYAAAILVGAGIGSAVVASADRDHRASAVPLAPGERHYSDAQKDLMFMLLDAPDPIPRDTLHLASRELAGCMACHDGGLRNKLIAEIGP